MDETVELIYLSPEVEMEEDIESACSAMLYELANEAYNEAIEAQKFHAFPQVEMARIIGHFAYSHERMISVRDVLSEMLEKDERAGDLLCYTTELLKAMDSMGTQLKDAFYSCCQLVLDVNEDEGMIGLMTETANEMKVKEINN